MTLVHGLPVANRQTQFQNVLKLQQLQTIPKKSRAIELKRDTNSLS